MKRYLIYNLFMFCSLLVFMSCKKEEIEKNLPEASIYLDARSNSFDYNFTNYPIENDGIIVNIKVNTIGGVKDYDRPFQLIVQDSSTAIEGIHFEFVENNLAISAEKLIDSVQIRLLRHQDLLNTEKTLYLLLKEGADFHSPIVGFNNISTIVFRDQTLAPLLWPYSINYLGTYSEKKFKLYQEVAGMPVDALDSLEKLDGYFTGKTKLWGTLLNQYLEIQTTQGNIILDEDGSPMKAGDYIYN